MIKCVIWDLDNTLLHGTYLESPGRPPDADRELAPALRELAGRGVLQAVASRNPPEAAEHAERVTGHRFAAVRCGWGAKSAAITGIMTELGLAAGEVAFVDDDALERAEVGYRLPGVLVLAPQDLPGALEWPDFSPPALTDEGRRRGELYRQRRVRQDEASAFGGSREDFLRYAQTRVTIAPAEPADLPRLHELSVRTHQFNSAGAELGAGELAGLLAAPDRCLAVVRLADKFGDDGIVGGCVITVAPRTWEVGFLMMSCRALGRGVIEALLGWICLRAQAAGAGEVALPCVISPRNVPLRIALTGAGFRAAAGRQDDGEAEGESGNGQRSAWYRRPLGGQLAELPSYVSAPGAWP